MKILLVGGGAPWMQLHLSHIQKGFLQAGHDCRVLNYNASDSICGMPCPKFLKPAARRHGIGRAVKEEAPDVIFLAAAWSFGINRIRRFFKGPIIVWDLDGPRRLDRFDFEGFAAADLRLTASRYMQRHLNAKGISSTYLPSAADPDFYQAISAEAAGLQMPPSVFGAIGRATRRRAEILKTVVEDLSLYGGRWTSSGIASEYGLDQAIRLERDIQGQEVTAVYSNVTAFINLLQEPLDQYRTILNLQCFAVPMTGRSALVTEFVEEIPEHFEPGKEILCFSSTEELSELAQRIRREPAWAQEIARAGQVRAHRCHTHLLRVQEILRLLA